MNITEAENILELKRPYTQDDLSKAYRAAVRVNHPDAGGDPNKMVKVNAAKEVVEKYLNGSYSETASIPFSSSASSTNKGEYDPFIDGFFNNSSREPHSNYNANRERMRQEETKNDIYSGKNAKERLKKHGKDYTDTQEFLEFALENRVPFIVEGKIYRFSSLILSISMRILVFIGFIIAIIAYMSTARLSSMESAFDILGNAFSLFAIGILFCGYISRRILQMLRIFVRYKDAVRFVAKKLEKIAAKQEKKANKK